MRAAAEDMCGGDAERIFTSDTRDLMGFFVILRKLLREVKRLVAAMTTTPANECSVAFKTSPSTTSINLPMAVL
jgi:hypothetical protein